jgi:hypothetical protein
LGNSKFRKRRVNCQFFHVCLTLGLNAQTLAVRLTLVPGELASPTLPGALARMTDVNKKPLHAPAGQAQEVIPEELALQIRKMAHDLSNALEIIVQTSYLLSTADLKAPASDWLGMLDSGVTKALDINQSLRAYIKAHAPK